MGRALIWLLFSIIFCTGYAEVQTSSSLEPIQKEIGSSPKGTLVLLDIGDTLLSSSDTILHPTQIAWKREWFLTHCPGITQEEKLDLERVVLGTIDNWRSLDIHWPQLIQQAQDQGFKVVAFSRGAWVFSTSADPAEKLRAFGFPFKDDLPELSKGYSFTYAKGVIATINPLKGPVLHEILSHLSSRPEKIIFVDDKIEQIKSVDNTCRELGIPCTAFHFVSLDAPPQLDEKIADYQLSTLVREHRWVSDKDACVELEKRMIPFPHFPNKASYTSLHTPKARLEYRKKTGTYPTLPPPTTLILCYNEAIAQYLVQKYRHQSCDGCFSEVIYLLDYPGVALACFGIGAPTNAMKIDEAIAWGVKQFISIGTACTIQKGLSQSDLIVCEKSIRDEGISHHYLPYSKYAYPSRDLKEKLISVLRSMNKSYHVGTSLTSDAFYKISKEEVEFFQKEGVLCVEMESAAQFAVASLHEDVKIAAIFTLMSDNYSNLEWERPVFDKEKKKEAFDQLLTIALQTAKL